MANRPNCHDSETRGILSQILEVESSFSIGQELDGRAFTALPKGIAEGKKGGVFGELPIHQGDMTD